MLFILVLIWVSLAFLTGVALVFTILATLSQTLSAILKVWASTMGVLIVIVLLFIMAQVERGMYSQSEVETSHPSQI